MHKGYLLTRAREEQTGDGKLCDEMEMKTDTREIGEGSVVYLLPRPCLAVSMAGGIRRGRASVCIEHAGTKPP